MNKYKKRTNNVFKKSRISDRDIAIFNMAQQYSYRDVGREFGISGARVEQIVRKFGPSSFTREHKRRVAMGKKNPPYSKSA